ncbi:MAG: hypothetical protein KatS3mg131_0360 [Candidatus Tectimicrobiota bacterium]|nr:MAG: hypothetical protein KatS3mg131_0360 [Candidatus Tectomicrobia bacterium]
MNGTAGQRWLLVAGYAAMIFVLSALPGESLPRVNVSDKLIHAAEFGLFAVLLCRALRAQFPQWRAASLVLLSVLIATAYGASDEAHQLLVSQRVSDFADLAADALGALLAAWGWGQGQPALALATVRPTSSRCPEWPRDLETLRTTKKSGAIRYPSSTRHPGDDANIHTRVLTVYN